MVIKVYDMFKHLEQMVIPISVMPLVIAFLLLQFFVVSSTLSAICMKNYVSSIFQRDEFVRDVMGFRTGDTYQNGLVDCIFC